MSAIIDTRDGYRLEHMCSESTEEDAPAVSSVLQALDAFPETFANLYRGSSLTTLSSVLSMAPRENDLFRQKTPGDVGDYLGVVASDPSGFAIQIGAVTPGVAEADEAYAPMWNRVCTHIAAGFRLHRTFEDISLDTSDAVLDPDGTLEHANDERMTQKKWRDTLGRAAVNVERARREFRGEDSDAGLQLWKGLVRGTFSLVETVDSDGRRFYVARKNDLEVSTPHPLSPRERQVVAYVALGLDNRQIAYRLGLSDSTISTYVRRASNKLGVDSRANLIKLVRQLANQSEEDATI
jgi:DNA-binding CsgD family transcriptional regulator